MGFLEADEVSGRLEAVADRLKKQGIIRSFNRKTRVFTVRRRGQDCIFLSPERRCLIYERRPFVCRRFPEGGARPGYCPHQKRKQESHGRTMEA